MTGTVADLPQLAKDENIKAPALIIIGHVVKLQAQLQPQAVAALL